MLAAAALLALAPAVLADPVRNPDNGHYYEVVPAPSAAPFLNRISWTSARTMAEGMFHKNVQGHLATVTSEEENDFIKNLPGFDSAFVPFRFGPQFGDVGPWLGGTLAGPDWIWITGEGVFSDSAGAPPPGGYVDWLFHEPNGFAFENRLGYFRSRVSPLDNDVGWADFPEFEFNVPAFIVEYDIPEPGSLALVLAGMALLFRRRRS